MTEDALALRMNYSKSSSELAEGGLVDVARTFGRSKSDLLDNYIEERGFTALHKVLLGINASNRSLSKYLSLIDKESLASEIDQTDAYKRTPLA